MCVYCVSTSAKAPEKARYCVRAPSGGNQPYLSRQYSGRLIRAPFPRLAGAERTASSRRAAPSRMKKKKKKQPARSPSPGVPGEGQHLLRSRAKARFAGLLALCLLYDLPSLLYSLALSLLYICIPICRFYSLAAFFVPFMFFLFV